MSALDHFAIMIITYTFTPTAVIIYIRTNNPAHLTCYYTDTPPRKHHTTRIIRGATVPWGVYFCFVGWVALEQQEAGDTLAHTFIFPDWQYCKTLYFTFRGTVGEKISPSVGPIFQKHNSLQLYEQLTGAIDGSYALHFSYYRHAQTFTAESDHQILGFNLRLWKRESPGVVTASLTDIDANEKPVYPALTTGKINGDLLSESHPGEWAFIPSTPYNLIKNTHYAIVLQTQDPRLYWTAGPYNGYPGHHHWISHDSGATWFGNPWHLFFQVWGQPLF